MRKRIIEALLLMRHRRFSADELANLRNRHLQAVIRHAFHNVPFYRSLFRSAGLSPGDITTVDDLSAVPVTPKDDLRAAGARKTVARGTDLASCHRNRTSGSMAKPFETWLSESELWRRRVLGFRQFLGIGYRPWDRVCYISGPGHLPGYRFRTKTLSPLLPLDQQIRALREARPTIIKAWPGWLRVMLHHTKGRLGEIVRPRAVITSGEICDPSIRSRVKDSTGAEVFAFYGAGETGPIAAECRFHSGLHLHADHLILECLKDGGPAAPGEWGSAVITSLSNYVMPFIRYELGDVVAFSPGSCSCGSAFPLIEPPVGRNEEVIGLPDGSMLSVLATTALVLKRFPGIQQYRLIQETPHGFVLQIALRGPLGTSDRSLIRSRIGGLLGGSSSLEVRVVDVIPELPGVKFRRFISHVEHPK